MHSFDDFFKFCLKKETFELEKTVTNCENFENFEKNEEICIRGQIVAKRKLNRNLCFVDLAEDVLDRPCEMHPILSKIPTITCSLQETSLRRNLDIKTQEIKTQATKLDTGNLEIKTAEIKTHDRKEKTEFEKIDQLGPFVAKLDTLDICYLERITPEGKGCLQREENESYTESGIGRGEEYSRTYEESEDKIIGLSVAKLGIGISERKTQEIKTQDWKENTMSEEIDRRIGPSVTKLGILGDTVIITGTIHKSHNHSNTLASKYFLKASTFIIEESWKNKSNLCF
eukprot:Platyproteum_vivax@DN14956_c0_g1_i1.p1